MRRNSYKDNASKFESRDDYQQRHLYEHFLEPGHTGFIEDVYINLIGKTDPSKPIKREDYW